LKLHATQANKALFDAFFFGSYDQIMNITHPYPEKAYTGSNREYLNNIIIGIVYQ